MLHRVGSDRAAPLDSTKSGADGRFRFRYTPSGSADALYFVSARHHGIAYFSPPLRSDVVKGGDADVIVYDTTSDTTKLRVQGRHFVVSAPRGGRREIAEVVELENEGMNTVVSRQTGKPLWSMHLPASADSANVAPGDIGAGAVEFRDGRAEVFAPISPGVRQLVVTYLLPAKAFPVDQPVERNVGLLEVLVEEPRAIASGAKLAEVASTSIEGRPFRRFLAQDVPANGVIHVEAPEVGGSNPSATRVLFIVLGVLMAAALLAWLVMRQQQLQGSAISATELTIAELAALDARYEKNGIDRTQYESMRAALKARVERELAAEHQPS